MALLWAVVLIIVIVGVLWFVLRPSVAGGFPGENLFSFLAPSNSSSAAVSGAAANGSATYTDASVGFSFAYPAGASANPSAGDDSGGSTVVVEAQGGRQAQVAAIPFDETISLTADRIHQDIPDMQMNNVTSATVAGAAAVSFETTDTRELWFVSGGYLYQITELLTTPANQSLIPGIAQSFRFPQQ